MVSQAVRLGGNDVVRPTRSNPTVKVCTPETSSENGASSAFSTLLSTQTAKEIRVVAVRKELKRTTQRLSDSYHCLTKENRATYCFWCICSTLSATGCIC